jgi:hypothetical protein
MTTRINVGQLTGGSEERSRSARDGFPEGPRRLSAGATKTHDHLRKHRRETTRTGW